VFLFNGGICFDGRAKTYNFPRALFKLEESTSSSTLNYQLIQVNRSYDYKIPTLVCGVKFVMAWLMLEGSIVILTSFNLLLNSSEEICLGLLGLRTEQASAPLSDEVGDFWKLMINIVKSCNYIEKWTLVHC